MHVATYACMRAFMHAFVHACRDVVDCWWVACVVSVGKVCVVWLLWIVVVNGTMLNTVAEFSDLCVFHFRATTCVCFISVPFPFSLDLTS